MTRLIESELEETCEAATNQILQVWMGAMAVGIWTLKNAVRLIVHTYMGWRSQIVIATRIRTKMCV